MSSANARLLGPEATASALGISLDAFQGLSADRMGPRPHLVDDNGNGIAWTAERVTAWRKQQRNRARGERNRACEAGR